MSKVISLPKDEVVKIEKSFSADTSMTYSPRQLITIEDCKEQYLKADEVSHIAQQVIKDRMQGDALLKAKKLICGDEKDKNGVPMWCRPKLPNAISQKWKDFWSMLGTTKSNVNYLLDFAGYKERGGEIETASHYREVKKLATDKKDVEEIDAIYKEAGGEDLSTAKEVKEAVQKSKVWVQPLFEKEVGKQPQVSMSSMMFGLKLQEAIPEPSESEWKSFYRAVASCIHPDKGGSAEHTAILTQLNKMYQLIFSHRKEVKLQEEWWRDYKLWKEDRGYESDFIDEDKLKK